MAAGQRARRAGLEVGEGQARILLGDLRAHQGLLQQRSGREVSEAVAARRCRLDRFELSVLRAHGARGRAGDPVQAFVICTGALQVRRPLTDLATRLTLIHEEGRIDRCPRVLTDER